MDERWRLRYFCGACKAFGKLMFFLSMWIVLILWTLSNLDDALLLAAFGVAVVVALSAITTACAEPKEERQDDVE